jgi:hypothetical protein
VSRQKLAVAVALLAALAAPAGAATLITEHEAQLPANDAQLRGGIERGPEVIAVYPAPKSGGIQSPFAFRVKFVPHGGTNIDLDTITVKYERTPEIDLTVRIKPFLSADGINMPDAEVPPGSHRIWIFVRDSVGHEGRADIHFDVLK